jgi:hypothetical protein
LWAVDHGDAWGVHLVKVVTHDFLRPNLRVVNIVHVLRL